MLSLEQQIRERAYHMWIDQGRQGSAEQHWIAAEREILAGFAKTGEHAAAQAPAKQPVAKPAAKKAKAVQAPVVAAKVETAAPVVAAAPAATKGKRRAA